MPIPNNGLITETNRQYYEGAQGFIADGAGDYYTTTFNTDLILGNWNPSNELYALNNFKVYTSASGLPGTFVEYVGAYNNDTDVNVLYIPGLTNGTYIVVQLKKLDGGNYGVSEAEKAYGTTTEDNYGSYAYIKLNDVVNNFMVAYVGEGKLIPNVKRTDVIFHAKRSMQEFSYDTLKSIKSQELTVPHNLSIILPQDYVNYVKISWIDHSGIKRPLYPTNNLTIIPYETPLQDNLGEPIQDNFDDNIEGSSITKLRWENNRANNFAEDSWGSLGYGYGYGYDQWLYYGFFGQRYGLDPQYANSNGYFTIDDRLGKISFSSNLIDKIVVLEYISDGLAYDMDTRVPKLAEEAMYAYIIHAILSLRINQPEYIIQRLKQEKSAKLRNAKIRLSNIKLEEISQVLRGQSKWIKH